MSENDTPEAAPPSLSLRERLGRWLLGADRPVPPTVTQLQADFAQLRLEWADTVDFIQHWAGRQAKRDAKALKSKLAADPEPELTPVTTSPALDKSELRRRAAALRTHNGHNPFPS